MEDSKNKQIKFKPRYSSGAPAAAVQHNRGFSHHSHRLVEENTKQTTLKGFFWMASGEGGVN